MKANTKYSEKSMKKCFPRYELYNENCVIEIFLLRDFRIVVSLIDLNIFYVTPCDFQ